MAGELARSRSEVTWRDARGVCRWTLACGLVAVGVLMFLRLFVASLQFSLGLFLPVVGLVILLGREYDGRSRFRLLLTIEAGLAIPLSVGHLIGFMNPLEEVMVHVILLAFVPLFWAVYSLREWAWGKERPFG
jgi:hypothetical protein